jgi:hypothetical protein
MCERIAARAGLHPIWGLNWEPGFTLIGTQLGTTPPDWMWGGVYPVVNPVGYSSTRLEGGGVYPVGEGSTVGR